MQKQKHKKMFRPATIMLVLAAMLFFGNSAGFLIAAEELTPPSYYSGPESKDGENVSCQAQMKIFTEFHMEQYEPWMEAHFENKSSTTSLLDDAFSRFKQLRKTLYEEYYKYTPHQGAYYYSEGLEYSDCRQIVEKALTKARNILEQKARGTSTVKKTTILIYKYQEINDKLAQLTRSFLKMKAHLNTFSDKLPCYIKKQCNKG
jgi:hypothetical protein